MTRVFKPYKGLPTAYQLPASYNLCLLFFSKVSFENRILILFFFFFKQLAYNIYKCDTFKPLKLVQNTLLRSDHILTGTNRYPNLLQSTGQSDCQKVGDTREKTRGCKVKVVHAWDPYNSKNSLAPVIKNYARAHEAK